jgi:branched-chain amino acid transport system substrate-binding protein
MALLAACSLTTTDVFQCRNNEDCRGAFGLSSICNSDGLCEAPSGNPRCEMAFPDDLLTNPTAHSDTIVFGSIMERGQPLFAAFERSARLAIKQANDEGGASGRKFGIVFCTIDDGYADGLVGEEAAVLSARHLVDVVGVPAIFGPATSGDTQAVFQEVGQDGVLVISPSATSPALTNLDPAVATDDSPGLMWRTAPPDSLQGEAIAFDMRAPGPGRSLPLSRVAAVYEQGPYGEGLALEFAQEFQDQGGSMVTLRPFETAGQRDSFVTQVGLDAMVQEVLFVSSDIDDINSFFSAAATITGYDTKGIFLSDAAATDDVLMGANSTRFSNVRATRPAPLDKNTDLVYATFLASYLAEYGDSADGQVFTAHSYDAAWLLTYGASWALLQEDAITGRNIARGLRRLTSGSVLSVGPTSWVTIQQQFMAGSGINVRGASGPLDFDAASEETTANIEIWTITGTSITPEYTWPL